MEGSVHYLAIGNCDELPFPAASRYKIIGRSPLVVRDLYPERPTAVTEIPLACRPYQRLNAQRWAVPQVHACLAGELNEGGCILLTDAPLSPNGIPWPRLDEAWLKGSLLQQLGWWVQLAQLWDSCLREQVASSLLNLANVRVQTWQIRLLHLVRDISGPSLQDLGASWLTLEPSPPLFKIAQALATGQMIRTETLIAALEALAITIAPAATLSATGATHVGRRSNNEDSFTYNSTGTYGIVCDGMGGHEGGELASQLALESLQADLISLDQCLDAARIRGRLTEALYRAHSRLWEINLQQGRTHYRRIGTTAVVCYLSGPLLHIAHVGDSRIYLIDREHCQQLTVDDDVANYEVSLAHTTTNAMQQTATGGHLMQALGVVPTEELQPRVQTFVLPEECLVLLCSDGLCDGGLVERFWPSMLAPLLHTELNAGSQALIDLALKELGHDNITFVVIKYLQQNVI
ncbi:MAG: protein phosphatase 2C domain-containing protein [Gemmatimonadaceae bacterium]|nr:protein phosphatase 2C domain-containing protein [Gloeobacterales cyanobacterium ES-bin-141]